ncbi:MAG: hypothetical protein IJA94_01855 [Bacilli bacterium]|nr:hypothetical protein [Bacilli bacterium]
MKKIVFLITSLLFLPLMALADVAAPTEVPSYSSKEFTMYFVCGAIAIALVAFVVIKIINQRKEMKKNLTSDNNSSSNIEEK